MQSTDIQAELKRSVAQMDAAQGGAIIVWHDPDGEFESTLDELELPGIEVVRERENHSFELKCAQNEDLSGRSILLYRTRARSLEGDWLADVEMRAGQFSADYASMQLRDINAEDTPEMRALLAAHKAFFGKKRAVKKLCALAPAYTDPQQVELGMIAVTVNAASIDPADVLRAWLLGIEDNADEDAVRTLEDAGLLDALAARIHAWTGFEDDITDHTALAQHILLSCIAPQLGSTALQGFDACFNENAARFCSNVFETWLRADDGAGIDTLRDTCQSVEEVFGLLSLLESAPTEALMPCDTFPCIDAAILERLMAEVARPSGDFQAVLSQAAERRARVWHREFEVYYRAVEAAARMQELHRACDGVIEAGTPKELWSAYTGTLCAMDRWYRVFNESLAFARKNSRYALDDALKQCARTIENLYKNWFLRELSKRWLGACAGDLAAHGHASGIPLQLDFDMAEVGPATRAAKRTWVIVSDALRYEVAQELGELIQHETRCTCELDAVQSVFPSITRCGMSALLPAGTFRMEAGSDGLEVLVDGNAAYGTETRAQQLAAHYPGAVAVQYETFVNRMTTAERKELVTDAPLVYIYHNTIDALGDKAPTETKTFDACREAILELKALVERLVREQKASSIIITADHGFLYTAEPLEEHESASVSNISGTVVDHGRRYAVAKADATSDAFLPVALPSDDLVGFCPRECVRIKLGGGGNNFVHGGFTLQECCVPVLRCSVKRKGARGYVETTPASISVITELGTITNGMFGVDVLQDAPVSATTAPATYELFVGDAAHAPVTNIATVVADRVDEDARARTSHLQFTIKPGVDTDEHAAYALYARNVQTKQIQSLRPLKISIAFAPLDFGF